uniref:2-phosphoxylose phosphatase 1 n=1 Tax=Capitella teleta TaxID=283909 RepID=X2BBC3_CAPTE
MRLLSVHTVIRHGDRNNLHGLPNYDNPKLTCRISDSLRMTFPVLGDYQNIMKDNLRKGGRLPDQTFHGYDIYPDREFCSPGWLTPEGAVQHILHGQLFKQKYLLKHKLLNMQDFEDSLFVRTTDYPRTFQSAMALLFGFLSKFEIEKLKIEKADNNTMCSKDTGHPCTCPMVVPFIDTMSATYKSLRPELRQSSIGKDLYSHLAQVLDVGDDALPPPSHIMDNSMVHMCHNLLLPTGPNGQCMKSWAITNAYNLLAQNGKEQLQEFNRIARLKFQPLMHEIAERMLMQVMGKSPIKFALYSGHDTTIEPLAAALNFSGGIWSPYASRIVFELYAPQEESVDSSAHSIRVLYNGKVVTKDIPFCKDKMHDSFLGLCPLDAFIKFVRKDNLADLGETDYNQACSKMMDT